MATLSRTSSPEPPQLQPLAQRLKVWRAIRSPGQRIPEDLWKAAVDLARVHGLSRTATALRLGYYDLQRRLAGGRGPGPRCVPAPTFVELAPLAALAGPGDRGTLELVQTSGARLTLRLPGASPNDLLPIVQLFLRHRS
jgi:hypothetical protein